MPKVESAYPYLAKVVMEDGPFHLDQVVVVMGELANMRGHVVVVSRKDGRVYAGWHKERFRKLRANET